MTVPAAETADANDWLDDQELVGPQVTDAPGASTAGSSSIKPALCAPLPLNQLPRAPQSSHEDGDAGDASTTAAGREAWEHSALATEAIAVVEAVEAAASRAATARGSAHPLAATSATPRPTAASSANAAATDSASAARRASAVNVVMAAHAAAHATVQAAALATPRRGGLAAARHACFHAAGAMNAAESTARIGNLLLVRCWALLLCLHRPFAARTCSFGFQTLGSILLESST